MLKLNVEFLHKAVKNVIRTNVLSLLARTGDGALADIAADESSSPFGWRLSRVCIVLVPIYKRGKEPIYDSDKSALVHEKSARRETGSGAQSKKNSIPIQTRQTTPPRSNPLSLSPPPSHFTFTCP
jgi:hypothetical protein